MTELELTNAIVELVDDSETMTHGDLQAAAEAIARQAIASISKQTARDIMHDLQEGYGI